MSAKLKKVNVKIESISVDGKETYNGAEVLGTVTDDGKIILKTSIGKNKVQELIIVFCEDNSNLIIEDEKTSDN
jgi:hypothetical protein